MSPIEAAATAIDIHNTASGWNKALLDNSARPSGALVYAASNGQMNAEQFEHLKAELETSFQGAAALCFVASATGLAARCCWKAGLIGSRRCFVASATGSMTPKDMDFIEAKNSAAREIALALGVPPSMRSIASR